MGRDVYLAARVSRTDELKGYAVQLLELGYGVTSQWLAHTGAHANRSDMSAAERGEIAARDLHDIRRADVVILFTEAAGNGPAYSPPAGNGRLVEFGYALGRNKMCMVVGPHENLFMCLPTVWYFETWESFYAWLKADKEIQEHEFKDVGKGWARTFYPKGYAQQGGTPPSDATTPGVVRGTGHPVQ